MSLRNGLAAEGLVGSNHTATGCWMASTCRAASRCPSVIITTEELIPVNKYQIRFAAAALAASFVNNAATIDNVASGSVAVIVPASR
jgi:hypothetical protein